MGTLGEAVVNIRANLAPLKRGLAAARIAVTRAMLQISSRALISIRAGINRLGASLMRLARILSIVVVGALAASIKAAADFQTEMAGVNTMLDASNEHFLIPFAEGIEEMSKRFGQSSTTLSTGVRKIRSAMVPAAETLGLLEVASKTATGGITDVATATSALIAIMNSYGMEASDATEISDKMFAAFERGLFTFEELATSIGRISSTASLVGVSLSELLGIIATTTRNGVNMAEAVTAVNAVMNAFIDPNEKAMEAVKGTGLELSAATLRAEGFTGAAKKLIGAAPKLVAEIAGGRRGFKALASAVKDTSALIDDVAFISDRSAGLMESKFTKMSSTAGFQLRRFGQQAIWTGRALGDPLLDPFKEAIVGLNDKFGRLEGLLERNREKIRAFGDGLVDAFKPASDLFDTFLADLESEGFSVAIKNALDTITKAIGTWINENSDSLLKLGVQMGEILIKGFNQAMKNLFGQFHRRQIVEIKELGEFLRILGSAPAVELENARIRRNREFENRMGVNRPRKVGELN